MVDLEQEISKRILNTKLYQKENYQSLGYASLKKVPLAKDGTIWAWVIIILKINNKMNHNNICKWIQICQLWLNPRIHNDALIRQLGKCEFWWLVHNVKESRSKNGNWSYVFKIILIFKRCMQPILNIHRFSICGSLYSQNWLVTPKSIPSVFLWSFTDMWRMAKALSHPPCIFLHEADQGDSAFLIHSPDYTQMPFLWSI